MRVYVVNVGVNVADAARRGARSPIFADGTFEFVPIKEGRQFSRCREVPRYCDLPAQTGRAESLAAYVPPRISRYRVHNEPEFETFTYGDVMSPRAANLKHVEAGDQVWFLTRLWSHDGARWGRGSDFYFIGRVVVELNLLISAGSRPEDVSAEICRRIENNPHYRRWVYGNSQEAFRIVIGRRPGSGRFGRAVRITPEVAGLLFGGSYDRETGMFCADGQILKNRNGRPRRFDTFGSVTRTIQAFIDTAIRGDSDRLAALERVAGQHAS
jgi:hypothetical protein